MKVVQTRSLVAEVGSFSTPFHHLVGKLDLSVLGLLADGTLDPGEMAPDPARADLCAYGLGRRRQYQPDGSRQGADPLQALAHHPELRALVIAHCQQALGCDLTGTELRFHARRCVDEADYALSPHADCPKTICAMLIYLWQGQRGTSLYRLSGYSDSPPAQEPGLLERVNNFSGQPDYQRGNLDVISQLKPGCFAYFDHVKTIRPEVGVFLLIPNSRYRGALLDLPPSHHGVRARASALEPKERRDLVLIDVKLPNPPQPTLRSLLKARLSRKRKPAA